MSDALSALIGLFQRMLDYIGLASQRRLVARGAGLSDLRPLADLVERVF